MIKIATIAAAALCLGFSGATIAQTSAGSEKSQSNAMQKCEGLTGAALDKCKREAAASGRTDDAPATSPAPGDRAQGEKDRKKGSGY